MLESAKSNARRVFLMTLTFFCVLTIALVGLAALAWGQWLWLQTLMNPPLAAVVTGLSFLSLAVILCLAVREKLSVNEEDEQTTDTTDSSPTAVSSSASGLSNSSPDITSVISDVMTDPVKLRWISLGISMLKLTAKHKKSLLLGSALAGLVIGASPRARAELVDVARSLQAKYTDSNSDGS